MTTILEYDKYLAERGGHYGHRSVRYRAAAEEVVIAGLNDADTLYDLGAGMTEFDHHLRTEYAWRGRYIPIDGAIDGTNLDRWRPPRKAEHAVALEILEHLRRPDRLVGRLQRAVTRSIVVSVPNPRTVDVLGIDRTHRTIVTREMLESWGFIVEERTFYGGVYSSGEPDALLGVWRP